MFLAGCSSRSLARLSSRAPSAALRARSTTATQPAGRFLVTTRAVGTDTRFRIPGREVKDEDILTVDDEEIEARRDGQTSRLVQVWRGAAAPAASRPYACAPFHAKRGGASAALWRRFGGAKQLA